MITVNNTKFDIDKDNVMIIDGATSVIVPKADLLELMKIVQLGVFEESISQLAAVMPAPETLSQEQLEEAVENSIEKLLDRFYIRHNIKGYRYIKEALKLAVFDDQALEMMTKYLYPHVAKKCGPTNTRVERAIRHAIESSCNFSPEISAAVPTNPTTGKPTNGEFLSTVKDMIRRELKIK